MKPNLPRNYMDGLLTSCTWGTWDYNGIENEPNPRNNKEYVQSRRNSSRSSRSKRAAGQNEEKWFEVLLSRYINQFRIEYSPCPLDFTSKVDWNLLAPGVDPSYGGLSGLRLIRKRQQVENMAAALSRIIRPKDRIVEFCSGSGYVSLLLAVLYPQCEFVLLDMKRNSLNIATERIALAKVDNISIRHCLIDDFQENFDVGVALHSCGVATDMTLAKCIEYNACYAVAPCCVGKIKLEKTVPFPRSSFAKRIITAKEYEVLAKAADYGHTHDSSIQSQSNEAQKRRLCKSLMERDRNLLSEENGYSTLLIKMQPKTATPKNDIIVGYSPNN